MTLRSYLHRRAFQALLSESEKDSIQRSIAALRTRLNVHFQPPQKTSQLVFGSFRRGTILPRSMDPQSDIDMMVIFRDSGFRPQTYLDRLRRFVEARYQTSDIAQSNPTIVLDLNHIRFELVPALQHSADEFFIPHGADDWQTTAPVAFQHYIERRNIELAGRLKPAIRLLKFWNAVNGHVFPSFPLEQWAASLGFGSPPLIGDMFCRMIDALPTSTDAIWKTSKIERAKRIVNVAWAYETNHYEFSAEQEISDLIPPP